jgi:type IV secretory pathway protease TraF
VVEVNAQGNVMLAGDNPDGSTDSRMFGAVARSAIVGRVVYRYAPAARAGRVG